MTQYMKPWMLVALTMAVMLLVAPAVSAEEQKYTVRPSTSETPSAPGRIYDSIREGQTKTYYSNVGSDVNYLEVDLNWGDPTDSLSLIIYTPGGSNLGTYYDGDDGPVDGRIHLDIGPGQGYVEPGQWKFKVYGVEVDGVEDYTFNVYQH